jgi:uncharacterized DUF497 family protein
VFEWDAANEDKLLTHHNVSALEAEQCFSNPHTTRRASRDVYLLLGRTESGRMLLLVYQQRARGVVRVYSGREMTDAERRAYRRSMR